MNILMTFYKRDWGCVFFDPLRNMNNGKYSINKHIWISEGISFQSLNEHELVTYRVRLNIW
jgi:hypothetical protein